MVEQQAGSISPPRAPGRLPWWRSRWSLMALLTLALAVAIGVIAARRPHASAPAAPRPSADARVPATTPTIRVEVTRPTRGGLERTTVQPGSVHAFEYADLFAKVSGYLKIQKVDIGDRVRRGDVLAEIDMPELIKAVDQARASVAEAEARVMQAEARVRTAEATVEAMAAQLSQARADVEQYTAGREFRKKELDRITELAGRNAVEQKLVDEQQDQYEEALSAEHSAQAAVLTAQAQLAEAKAKVDQARADLEQARSVVQVNTADLTKAQVMADYAEITSPYDGVITRRSFHLGDFIRSAAEGETVPLLSVARTDLMRVVVQVPDRDVPFVDRGDPAEVRIDALDGEVFKGKVSRYAEAEDRESRTMRTEIDLPNPDGRLREGMYGGATIVLAPPSRNLTIPSSCLVEQSAGGRGAVFVVRDGRAHRVPVRVGKDNGEIAEILSGIGPDDRVVVSHSGALEEGMPVETARDATAASGGTP